MVHLYIQFLLRVDGSILAGVFLTSSFFCVVPESSYSSNEESSSLLVAYSSNCSVQLVALSECGFIQKLYTRGSGCKTGGCSAPLTSCGLLLGLPNNSPYTSSPQRSHIVLSLKTATVWVEMQSLIKPRALCTRVFRCLLGILNPVQKVCRDGTLQNQPNYM